MRAALESANARRPKQPQPIRAPSVHKKQNSLLVATHHKPSLTVMTKPIAKYVSPSETANEYGQVSGLGNYNRSNQQSPVLPIKVVQKTQSQRNSVVKTPDSSGVVSRLERFARKQSHVVGSSMRTIEVGSYAPPPSATVDQKINEPSSKARPSSTFRNENKSRHYGMLTPNSRQTVQQLNQFISELTNRETVPSSNLMRQSTAEATIAHRPVNRDSNSASGNVFCATATSSVKTPSIKRTIGRNFTRHTVANTVMQSEQSRNALITSTQQGAFQQQRKTQRMSSFINATVEGQQTVKHSLNVKTGLQLNFSSAHKLKEGTSQGLRPIKALKGSLHGTQTKLDAPPMINESSVFERIDLDEEAVKTTESKAPDQLLSATADRASINTKSSKRPEKAQRVTSLLLGQERQGQAAKRQTEIKSAARLRSPPVYKHTEKMDQFINQVTTETSDPEVKSYRDGSTWQKDMRFVARLQPRIFPKDLAPIKTVRHDQFAPFVQLADIEAEFDEVIEAHQDQGATYAQAQDLAKHFLKGKSCAVLAYGSHDSGKRDSLLGSSLVEALELDPQTGDQDNSSPRKRLVTRKISTSRSPTKKPTNRQLNSPGPSAYSISPKKRPEQEALKLEKPPTVDLKTMRLLQQVLESEHRGLAPRLIQAAFQELRATRQEVTLVCSFLTLHHENIVDLLPSKAEENQSIYASLKIRDQVAQPSPFKTKGNSFQPSQVQVEGLSAYEVASEQDCLNLLRIGERNRVKRLQMLDQQDSRQTSVFQLSLYEGQAQGEVYGVPLAQLNICNLADSDKVNSQEEIDARHLVDLKKIDLSIRTLEKVVTAIYASQSNGQRQPLAFRESKLTRLLAQSLLQKTLLIAHLSAGLANCKMTAETIQFIDCARNGNQANSEKIASAFTESFEERVISSSRAQQANLPQLSRQSLENQRQIEQMHKEMAALKAKLEKHTNPVTPQGRLVDLENIQVQYKRMVEENKRLKMQITQMKLILQQSSSVPKKSIKVRALDESQSSEGQPPPIKGQAGSVAVAVKTPEKTAKAPDGLTNGEPPNSTYQKKQSKVSLERLPSQIAKPGSALQQFTITPRLAQGLTGKNSNEVRSQTQLQASQRHSSMPNLKTQTDKSASYEDNLSGVAKKGQSLTAKKQKEVPRQSDQNRLTPSKAMQRKQSEQISEEFAPHLQADLQLKITETRDMPPPGKKKAVKISLDLIKRVCTQAEGAVEEKLDRVKTVLLATGKHRLVKQMSIVAWKKPVQAPKPQNWFPDSLADSDKPLRSVRQIQASESSDCVELPSPRFRQQHQDDTLGELGIYLDADSQMHQLDQSSFMRHSKPAVRPVLGSAKSTKSNVNTSHIMNHLESPNSQASFKQLSMIASDDSGQKSHIGTKGMFTGGRQRPMSNTRTGSVTEKDVSFISRIKTRVKTPKKRQKTQVVVSRGEPQPSRFADSWLTHGNSIGNGAIIRALPPDGKPGRSTGQQGSRPKQNQHHNVFRSSSKSTNSHIASQNSLSSGFNGLNGLSFGTGKAMAKTKAMANAKEGGPKAVSLPKKYVFQKKSGPALMPSQLSYKNRPVSPIEYDFRGRRVTPVKNLNSLPQNNAAAQTTKDTSISPSGYTPGKYARVAVSDLTPKK